MSPEVKNDLINDSVELHDEHSSTEESRLVNQETDLFSKLTIIDRQNEDDVEFTDFKLIRRKSKEEKSVNGLRLTDMDIGGDWKYLPIDEPEECTMTYKERIQTMLRKALQSLRFVRINQCFVAKDLIIGIEHTRQSRRERIDYGILLRSLMRENKSLREHFIEDRLASNQVVYKRIK